MYYNIISVFIITNGFLHPVLSFSSAAAAFHCSPSRLTAATITTSTTVTTNDLNHHPSSDNAIRQKKRHHNRNSIQLFMAARYGPNESIMRKNNNNNSDQKKLEDISKIKQKKDILSLIQKIQETEIPEHLPSLLTRNVDLILSMQGLNGSEILKEIIDEAQLSDEVGKFEYVTSALDFIVSFLEEFVEEAKGMDDVNKTILGRIIRAVVVKDNAGENKRLGRDEEEELDNLLIREKDNFTPGFLRHLEGECSRISAAQTLTPESSKMLQMMRIIQMRVVEELGRDLGEGALVLGQLLGYDDKAERLAVLDAGLMVRGADFATEISSLCDEALNGFEKVPEGVDPNLVHIVKEINSRVLSFIDETEDSFQ